MSSAQLIALIAVVVAVLALSLAVWLATALRRTRADVRTILERAGEAPRAGRPDDEKSSAPEVPVAHTEPLPAPVSGTSPQVVTRDGRVVVLPTDEQVIQATMGRPLVRGAVLSHGLLYALRPESRDRILGIIRREYRSRRKVRLKAGRRAARVAPVESTQSWLSGDTRRATGNGDS